MALKVLAEKVNASGMERESLTPQQKACSCDGAVLEEFQKVGVCTMYRYVACTLVCLYVCLYIIGADSQSIDIQYLSMPCTV